MLTYTYCVILKPDREDGGYVVSCGDMPKVITQGDTIEEALHEAEGALQAANESSHARAAGGNCGVLRARA